jgi:hypothetical protein
LRAVGSLKNKKNDGGGKFRRFRKNTSFVYDNRFVGKFQGAALYIFRTFLSGALDFFDFSE